MESDGVTEDFSKTVAALPMAKFHFYQTDLSTYMETCLNVEQCLMKDGRRKYFPPEIAIPNIFFIHKTIVLNQLIIYLIVDRAGNDFITIKLFFAQSPHQWSSFARTSEIKKPLYCT
jgi:hypothetical protein